MAKIPLYLYSVTDSLTIHSMLSVSTRTETRSSEKCVLQNAWKVVTEHNIQIVILLVWPMRAIMHILGNHTSYKQLRLLKIQDNNYLLNAITCAHTDG